MFSSEPNGLSKGLRPGTKRFCICFSVARSLSAEADSMAVFTNLKITL